jgi:hypothetical protein
MLKVKYLWALAVAALCVGGMSGLAVAQDGATVSDFSLPSALVWDEAAGATIDMENSGDTDWLKATPYRLRSVEGTTFGGVTKYLNRWGLKQVKLSGVTVAAGATETFDFTITAPPITGTFVCDWIMLNGNTPITPETGLVEATIDISRFPDVPVGHWADGEIEGCAGMVPFIVQGFPDGFYRPTMLVRRDAMAVFIRRGMDIAQTAPAEATFPDVPTDFWAYADAETLVNADVVQGYPNGYYRPEYVVTRDQMAVFVARAKGWDLTPPETADVFDDVQVASDVVPASHWAIEEIAACVANGVVQGYPDGLYRPNLDIDRAQMAVYSYRAFIDPDDPAVALGGPGLTDADPATEAATGISSNAGVDPSYAYVLFDAALLGPEMATAGGGTWDVTFEYRPSGYPTSAATSTSVPHNEAALTGLTGTYLVVSDSVPALAADTYTLVVIVEDKQGDLHELSRTVAFRKS